MHKLCATDAWLSRPHLHELLSTYLDQLGIVRADYTETERVTTMTVVQLCSAYETPRFDDRVYRELVGTIEAMFSHDYFAVDQQINKLRVDTDLEKVIFLQ